MIPYVRMLFQPRFVLAFCVSVDVKAKPRLDLPQRIRDLYERRHPADAEISKIRQLQRVMRTVRRAGAGRAVIRDDLPGARRVQRRVPLQKRQAVEMTSDACACSAR